MKIFVMLEIIYVNCFAFLRWILIINCWVCYYSKFLVIFEEKRVYIFDFLGGLSLHLNHLIAQRMSAPYWQFGTLPIGIFCQIWTQDSLRHLL